MGSESHHLIIVIIKTIVKINLIIFTTASFHEQILGAILEDTRGGSLREVQ